MCEDNCQLKLDVLKHPTFEKVDILLKNWGLFYLYDIFQGKSNLLVLFKK